MSNFKDQMLNELQMTKCQKHLTFDFGNLDLFRNYKLEISNL